MMQEMRTPILTLELAPSVSSRPTADSLLPSVLEELQARLARIGHAGWARGATGGSKQPARSRKHGNREAVAEKGKLLSPAPSTCLLPPATCLSPLPTTLYLPPITFLFNKIPALRAYFLSPAACCFLSPATLPLKPDTCLFGGVSEAIQPIS